MSYYAPTLRAVRAHFGLTQQALADWLGLSCSAYSVVEAAAADELLPITHQTGPTAEVLLAARRAACLADALRAYLA